MAKYDDINFKPLNARDKKRMKKINTFANNDKLVMRMVSVSDDGADDGSLAVVVATENPVQRYDVRTDEVVSEVLRMKGVEFRTQRKQLPIVDSHNNSTVQNVLGSVRDMKVVGDELTGRAYFADDDKSQEAYRKLRDGHLTDFSITATPNAVTRVRRGETLRVGKQKIEGPAEIVDRWRPLDASLVAIGADERSTVRSDLQRSYQDLHRKKDEDDMVSLELLHSLGMPKDITERSAVETWVSDNVATEAEAEAETSAEQSNDDADTEESSDALADATENEGGLDAAAADTSTDDATTDSPVAEAVTTERARQRALRDLGAKFDIQRATVETWCEKGLSVNVARKQVLETMSENNKPAGTSATVTGSSIERTRDAVKAGLIARAFGASGLNQSQNADAGNADTGMKYHSLIRMAETLLRSGGINTDRMAPRDIALVALGHKATVQRMNIARDGEAYHVTGSFQNLMLDASNKTLQAAYEEAPFTWNLWARQAQSVPDFRDINRIRFSEAPDLEVVPENHSYNEGTMSDSKESYSVEKFGRIFTVSWETLVNDDLDAISRVPAMQGNAARRTQNKKVYEVLTSNPDMADGNALFSAGHGNLDASGAAPSVAELNAAYLAMMTQTGLSGEIINVEPAYIIAPPSLRGTVLQLLGSFADPNAGGSNAGNSNTVNIHQNVLQPIIEPQLESASATSWYLAAQSARIDTVEIAFLQGEENPVLESEFDFDKDVWRYKIRQTFGVAPIDYRGLFKNPGA